MNKYKLVFSLAVISLIVSGIFFFSEQSGTQSHSLSNSLASYLTEKWVAYFNLDYLNDNQIGLLKLILAGPIRKLAHILIYTILGFCSFTGVWLVRNRKVSFFHVFIVIFFVFVVASCDELNQHFSSGRGASFSDVLIDTFGGCIGIYLLYLIRDFIRHLNNGLNNFRHNK